MLSLYPSIGPYERVGRYFVVYLAQVNISLAKDDGDHLSYDNLSKMTLGISELPKELHDRMLSGFADYVVNNLLVLVRGKSLCSLWSALFSDGRFLFSLQHKQSHFGYSSGKRPCSSMRFLGLRYARKNSVP